jgi:predicted nucleotide-binding protein
MSTNLELIQDLLNQAQEISYQNGKRDAVEKRAEMLFRKIFNDKTPYIKSLKEITYSPQIWHTETPESVFESKFNDGKDKLLNLLRVVYEDLQLNIIPMKSTSIADSRDVYIVHGYNEQMKSVVVRAIEQLKLASVILHEHPDKGKNIFQKFTDYPNPIYVIVLLSADEVAYEKDHSPETAQYRATQNVILELGYFIGKIGRERVLVLHETVSNFEIPTDYRGIPFVPFDKVGGWISELVKNLTALGIYIDENSLDKI